MKPKPPTAVPLSASPKDTLYRPREEPAPAKRSSQVSPPSPDWKMRPLGPTAIAVAGSMNVTPFSTVMAGARGLDQFWPPSVVLSDVPPVPTITPVLTLPKATPRSSSSVPPVRLSHVVPPFAVRRMVPPAPTATPVDAFVNRTEDSATVVNASCLNQPRGGGVGAGFVGCSASSPHEAAASASPASPMHSAIDRMRGRPRASMGDPSCCGTPEHHDGERSRRALQPGRV